MVVLVAAIGGGCGNDDRSAITATSTEPAATTAAVPSTTVATSTSTSSTSTPTTSTPTTTAASSTTTEPSTQLPRLLRPDGIGAVDFGTPADETITALTAILGPPDHDVAILPPGEGGGECVEGAGWADCLEVVNEGRIVGWTAHGLEVGLTDHGGWTDNQAVVVPLHLVSWRASRPASGPALSTSEGFEPGMTVGQLRATYPDFEGTYSEGIVDGVVITAPNGSYFGELDWDPTSPDNSWSELVRAVQRTLNARGADLAVDGEWGPASQVAWEVFLRSEGLEPPPTMWLEPPIGEALGLPADDFVVRALTGSAT